MINCENPNGVKIYSLTQLSSNANLILSIDNTEVFPGNEHVFIRFGIWEVVEIIGQQHSDRCRSEYLVDEMKSVAIPGIEKWARAFEAF